jgi:hypothetical protein
MNPPRTEHDDKPRNETEEETKRNEEDETPLLHDDDAAAMERTPLAAVVAWKAVAMEAMIEKPLRCLRTQLTTACEEENRERPIEESRRRWTDFPRIFGGTIEGAASTTSASATPAMFALLLK